MLETLFWKHSVLIDLFALKENEIFFSFRTVNSLKVYINYFYGFCGLRFAHARLTTVVEKVPHCYGFVLIFSNRRIYEHN